MLCTTIGLKAFNKNRDMMKSNLPIGLKCKVYNAGYDTQIQNKEMKNHLKWMQKEQRQGEVKVQHRLNHDKRDS